VRASPTGSGASAAVLPGARASPAVKLSSAAAASSASAASSVSPGPLNVGSGKGYDEETFQRDLASIAAVEQAEAEALRKWCEGPSRGGVTSVWHPDEDALLAADVKTFPTGEAHRWRSSAEMVPGKNAAQCQSRSRDEDFINTIKERSLRDAIEKFPKDGKPSDLGDLFNGLGDLLSDMGDEVGAERAYREGTRRAPAYAPCYASLASALSGRNDLAGAETVLRKGIANSTKEGASPDINVLYNDLGELLDDRGDERGAQMVFQEAIKNFSKDGDLSDLGQLFGRLGVLLDDMGDGISAEKAYREGTRRAPGYAPCYSYLADSLMERNDLKGAERVLQRVIKLKGANGECYFSLGDLRERQGDLTAAEAAYREAIILEPTDCESSQELGRLLENKGDMRGAETVYREALQAIPDFALSYAKRYSTEDNNILFNEFPSLRKLVDR